MWSGYLDLGHMKARNFSRGEVAHDSSASLPVTSSVPVPQPGHRSTRRISEARYRAVCVITDTHTVSVNVEMDVRIDGEV